MIDRKTIRERGIKESWLARKLGISQSHLHRILDGQRKWRPELHEEALRLINQPVQVNDIKCSCNVN